MFLTAKPMKKNFQMEVPNTKDNLLLSSLPCHPLKCKIKLCDFSITRYEKNTLTKTDCLTPIH